MWRYESVDTIWSRLQNQSRFFSVGFKVDWRVSVSLGFFFLVLRQELFGQESLQVKCDLLHSAKVLYNEKVNIYAVQENVCES